MGQKVDALAYLTYDQLLDDRSSPSITMKRCPTCNNDFPDDANFCPVDAGHLFTIDAAAPEPVRRVDTGGHELLDGRFALGEILSGHRTGAVYSAGDKEGTTAMVKLVAANVFPTSLLKQRTERELKQLQRLDHPGVAKILGYGRREDELWIATERVDGIPLSQFIAQTGPLPQARAVGLTLQIGSALEAAAKVGVTHRDLSPKNILVADGDMVKLINFGVPVPGPVGKESVQGVCEYVAPEQIEGRAVDQRCNIYSLGAIATLLLTGSPPFTGDSLSVLDAHVNAQVEPLGPNQGVSTELGQALLKSLEKTSSKRYMTLRQFLGDIEKATTTAAAGATAPGMPPAGRPGDMNKTLMGIAASDLKAVMGQQAPGAVGTPAPVSEMGPGPAVTALDHAPPAMGQQASAPEPVAPAPAPAAPVISQPVPAAAGIHGQGTAGGKKSAAAAPKETAEQAAKKNKGKFRETMWFKKGELDEAAARAAAQAEPEAGVSSKADEMEMDVRYDDDGSITEQDKNRLSLRTGATMMMEAMPEQGPVKNLVSADELMSEMTAGRNKILLGIAAGVVVVGIILVVALS